MPLFRDAFRTAPPGAADDWFASQGAPGGGGWGASAGDIGQPFAIARPGGPDPVALVRQWQASHPAAGGAALDEMVAWLQSQGVNASRYMTPGGPSNNELSLPGANDAAGKFKVFTEGNQSWYQGEDDSPGAGGGIGAGLETSPGYQFRLGEGLKALERSAAARGTLLTGGTLKGLTRFGQDYASNEYGQRVNQLMDLSRLGFGAAAQQASQGSAYANQTGNLLDRQATNLSDLLTQQGNAQSAGTQAQGNAWGNALTSGADTASQLILLNTLYGR